MFSLNRTASAYKVVARSLDTAFKRLSSAFELTVLVMCGKAFQISNRLNVSD